MRGGLQLCTQISHGLRPTEWDLGTRLGQLNTQATIKPCRRPLSDIESEVREWNILPFWKTFVTKKWVPFLSRGCIITFYITSNLVCRFFSLGEGVCANCRGHHFVTDHCVTWHLMWELNINSSEHCLPFWKTFVTRKMSTIFKSGL